MELTNRAASIMFDGGNDAGKKFPFRAVVFDLDGTLVDSLADVADAVNRVLADEGLTPLEEESWRSLMGEGAKIRMRTAFALRGRELNGEQLDARTQDFAGYYAAGRLQHTKPYDGANELVEELAREGIRTAVCTNKDEKSARAILRHLKLMPPIDDVAGPDTFGVQKPDRAHLLLLLKRMNIPPESAVLVGDSIHDIETARAAGIPVGVVDWGYSPVPAEKMGADFVLRHFRDLMKIAFRLE